MATTWLRAATEYFILVGLPLVGLVGLLHFGSSLQAPPAVYGVWELRSVEETQPSCTQQLFGSPLALVQSGRFLHAETAAHTWNGRLENGHLRLHTPLHDGACSGKIAVLDVPVSQSAAPLLHGTVQIKDCNACTNAHAIELQRTEVER